MTGFEVLYQLFTDQVDRQAIYAALPTIRADIDLVAADLVRLGRDVQTLNRRLTPLVDAMKRISG